ncbi:hypothetical protein [Pinibacter aurantiacus]|uniref:Uncharacterized protein n=1 Tax=Pinibacter aurantiacus TaxID=2851599 RepID=A0A9E2W4X6_9BACT|nr:hypothetical protein [Pinibacter aurantiacus]MBV4360255.1 hypothetical protein [Pinibacter aurantiacus]
MICVQGLAWLAGWECGHRYAVLQWLRVLAQIRPAATAMLHICATSVYVQQRVEDVCCFVFPTMPTLAACFQNILHLAPIGADMPPGPAAPRICAKAPSHTKPASLTYPLPHLTNRI